MNTLGTLVRNSLSLGLVFGMLALIGCGSGGDSGGAPVIGTGSGTGGDTAAMTVNQFTVTPSAVTVGKQVAIHWNVGYSTPAAGYTAEFHLNNQPSLVQGFSALTRVFHANGDMGGTSVGKDATVTCTYETVYGSPTLSCGSYGARYLTTFDLTKPMYGILRACTYNSAMQEVCAEKTVPLTFGTSAAKAAEDVVSPVVEGGVETPPPAEEAR